MGSSLTANWVKIEIPFLRGSRRKMFKTDPETCEPNEDGDNNKRKSDSGDLSSGDMTLKELLERSRKKRKILKSAGLRKQCLSKDSEFGMKEEESDLDTPLSVWKEKLSTKSKDARKCIREEVRSSLDSGVSVEAAITELSHIGSKDLFAALRSKCESPKVKIETLGTNHSDYQNVACVANASAGEDLAIKDNTIEFSHEVPKSVTGGDMENLEPISLATDSSLCGSSEVSPEFMELCQPISLSPCETVNFGKFEDREVPESINQSLPDCVFELTEGGHIHKPVTNCTSDEAIPGELGSDVHESCKIYSLQSQPSCQMDCDAAIEFPDEAANDSVQSKELSCDGNGCVSSVSSEVDGNGDTTHRKENAVDNFGDLVISSTDFHPSSSAQTGAESVYDGSPIAEENSVYPYAGLVSTGAHGARDCLSVTSNTSIGSTASEVFESHPRVEQDCLVSSNTSVGSTASEVFESQPRVEQDCLPRRLLSSRKAISPTSQKKLRQAVDFEDLYDGVQNPGPGNEAAKVSVCPVQVIGKPKKNEKGTSPSVPKGILKASHVSAGSPHDGAENSSVPARAQKAIAFSQRQMQDIESLAQKLINELKGMKDIVEYSLCSNEYSSSPPKYTVDEMKTAVHNAEEVEDTAKRWLSMMSKDCNRFCKIMRSAGKKSVAQRKKIKFADEAGGMLCHVKILDDCPDSELSPESESVELAQQS